MNMTSSKTRRLDFMLGCFTLIGKTGTSTLHWNQSTRETERINSRHTKRALLLQPLTKNISSESLCRLASQRPIHARKQALSSGDPQQLMKDARTVVYLCSCKIQKCWCAWIYCDQKCTRPFKRITAARLKLKCYSRLRLD